MLRRLLNIASIVCLVVCVALMGMWVRSFWRWDQIAGHLSDRQLFGIDSLDGRLKFTSFPSTPNRYSPWRMTSQPTGKLSAELRAGQIRSNGIGFAGDFAWNYSYLILPYWFAVLIAGAFSLARWSQVKYRFSLRTLLIATTILAVILGMIAWLDRAWIGK
jgi:hypothetical protein